MTKMERTKDEIQALKSLSKLGYKFCFTCKKPTEKDKWNWKANKCIKCSKSIDAFIASKTKTAVIEKANFVVEIHYSYISNIMRLNIKFYEKSKVHEVMIEGQYEDVYEKLQWGLINTGQGDIEWL